MAAPKPRRATYQDLSDVPEHELAEIIDGELVVSPRPAPRHALAASAVLEELGPPFKRGRGGPGGWMILLEPELRLGDDVLVPDLGGWRVERLGPSPTDQTYLTAVPDWVAEVLSPSTERIDRSQKLAIYARAGVRHTWLVHPVHRTLEVMRLHEGAWLLVAVYRDDQRVRVAPRVARVRTRRDAATWSGARRARDGMFGG